jgi:hypothetical protein
MDFSHVYRGGFDDRSRADTPKPGNGSRGGCSLDHDSVDDARFGGARFGSVGCERARFDDAGFDDA